MKRLIFFFWALIGPASAYLQAQTKEDVEMLACAAMEGRLAGSEGEKDAAQYIAERFDELGVEILSAQDLFGIRQENGDTLTSCNVVGCIKGYDYKLKDSYIVIGARLDNLGTYTFTQDGEKCTKIYSGANGNASGLAMLLELADRLNTNKVLLKRSVLVVAFGSTLKSSAGAWYFLNRSFKAASKIDAMVNLEMLGTPSRGFYAYTASCPDLNDLICRLGRELQPIYPKVVSNEPVMSCHGSFYEYGIPVVMFTSGMYPEYNSASDTPDILEYDAMERETEYIYNFCVELANLSEAPQQFRNAESSQVKRPDAVPYYDCEYKPTFCNNPDPANFLKKWVYTYLRYPQSAVEEGVQGKVLVDFVIDERGKVCDVRIARSLDPRLDAEVIRVIEASPDWKPGRLRGKKVHTQMSMYVEFRLTKNK